ncbi:MAG: hypothetical protein WC910_10090 [Bacteroidales bacterium]|jgi:predicted DNA-binding ribbon-helix-helix protein
MGITTSFTFSDDFKALLDKVSKDHGKTKTALIIEAVKQYSVGGVTESDLLKKIDKLTTDYKDLSTRLEEIRVLCMQILKNQQGG